MTVADFTFPVLCFQDEQFDVHDSLDSLTHPYRSDFRARAFDGMLVVDSGGLAQKIKTAVRVGDEHAKRKWRVSEYLSGLSRTSVELILDGEMSAVSVEEVRDRVLRGFEAWDDVYLGRDDFFDLRRAVEWAETVADIIRVLAVEEAPKTIRRDDFHQDLIEYLAWYFECPIEELTESTELSREGLGITWDDALGVVAAVAERYDIDISRFDASAHYSTAAQGILNYMDSRRRPEKYYRKPVTIGQLLRAVETKVWQEP